MNEAIKLAIEKGGYFPSFFDKHIKDEYDLEYHLIKEPQNWLHEAICLDPPFWQSLSKALGKENLLVNKWGYKAKSMQFTGVKYWYEYHAHRWLDSHFEGEQSEKKFWDNLIK